MKRYIIGWLALCLIMVISCQKEESFEVGNKPSNGSLLSEITGDCLPKTVNGTYIAASPLVPATNTITVSVDVKETGVYTVYTDTVNGYFFRATGIFVKLGTNTITLRSNGTPFAAGVNNFVVNYNNTACDIAVTVLPVGSTPAVFTLETTAGNCSGAVVSGSYATANPLNFTNTVKISVNVTTIGTYDISTTKNGMTFSAKSSFTTTGVQTVTLVGTGTPTVNGDNIVPITVGTTTCNFTVPVGNPAVGTLGTTAGVCTPATVNGTYTVGTVLVSATNTVQLQVNVTTAGVFSISTNTVAGMTFAASGSFATPTTTLVTLNGTGTPTLSGPQTFTVNFGTSSCTFSVPVTGGTSVAAFAANCATSTVNGTYKAGTALTAANTIILPVTVTTAGTYNITTTTVNGMTFTGTGSVTLATTSITLTGSGTPVTATTSNIPAPGTTACNIPITVTAAATIDWKFNIGATLYQGQSSLPDITYDVTTSPPFSILDYLGDNLAGDEFSFALLDLAGGVTAAEQYASTSTGTTNAGAFYFIDAGNTIDLTAEPATPPAGPIGNMIFIVTSHSTSTKTIVGTFSGTAFDAISNTTKTITNGTFTAKYQ